MNSNEVGKRIGEKLTIIFLFIAAFISVSEFRNSVAAETDLSGTWYAVVNSDEGRWDYKMILEKQSSERWTGTLTFTLNGKDPITTETAVESLGGGKLNVIWRPGKPNAQSFEGTYTGDKINVAGYGGQIVFSKK